MKKKGKGRSSREELAIKLERMVQALREGSFKFEDESWPLPEDFLEYKWELKIKEGKLKFALTFLLHDTPQGKITFSPKGNKKEVLSAKRIKKTMGAYWKSILRDLRAGSLPSPEDISRLEETFHAYRPFVEQSWARSWEECHHKVKALYEASREGDFALVEKLAAEISSLEKSCHRKHK